MRAWAARQWPLVHLENPSCKIQFAHISYLGACTRPRECANLIKICARDKLQRRRLCLTRPARGATHRFWMQLNEMQPAASDRARERNAERRRTQTQCSSLAQCKRDADDNSPVAFISGKSWPAFVLIGECLCPLTHVDVGNTNWTQKKQIVIVKEKRNTADGRWAFFSDAINVSLLCCMLSEKGPEYDTKND